MKTVITGIEKFPKKKKNENYVQLLKNDSLFVFHKKDFFLSLAYKRWLKESTIYSHDLGRMIIQIIEELLKNTFLHTLLKPSTEYGLYFNTHYGSEQIIIKYLQSINGNFKAVNPKHFVLLYFNELMNTIAKMHNLRGYAQCFNAEKNVAQRLFQNIILNMKHHRQKGGLLICAEDSPKSFGATVLAVEREDEAKIHKREIYCYVNLTDKGEVEFLNP